MIALRPMRLNDEVFLGIKELATEEGRTLNKMLEVMLECYKTELKRKYKSEVSSDECKMG